MNSRLEKIVVKIVSPLSKVLRRRKIFITCTPKSASTFLMRIIGDIIGARVTTFLSAYDRTEQDVNLLKVVEYTAFSSVTHQHMKCTDYNINILYKFNIKPIILTRNIYDSIISMKNHIHREPDVSWWPMAYIDKSFYLKSEDEQLDLIIDLFVPWYINFYVSWYNACKSTDYLWITYKELIEDKVNVINKVLNYYGINKSVTEDEVLRSEKNVFDKIRYNKGKQGVGKEVLSEVQKNRIHRLFSHYPEVDFSKII